MHGRLEYCSTTRLIGWAIGNGQPAELDVIVNGERIARIRCSRPRPDVSQERNPADIGFVFAFPKPVTASDVVTVCFPDGTPIANAPATPTRYESSFDIRTTARVAGWAVCDGEPSEVDVLVNDEWNARIRCDAPRPDLAQQGLPESSGFNFLFPRPLSPTDKVSVNFSDGTLLNGAPRTPTRYESSLDRCTLLRIEGWALCDGQPAELDIFVNNERRGHVRCDRPRPDLAQRALPMYAGFAVVFLRPVSPRDEIAIRFPDGTHVTGSPCNPSR